MTLLQKQPTTLGYNTIADGDDDETTVSVPLVPHPSLRSRTTNDDNHRGKKKNGYGGRPIVAVILTLVLGLSLYVGGPYYDGGASLRRYAGNLVDGTATSAQGPRPGNAFAAVIDAGFPPEDAVTVPLEEPDDATGKWKDTVLANKAQQQRVLANKAQQQREKSKSIVPYF